jgi:hypothetical protein
MGHDELVRIAARWLRNTESCSVVISEMHSQAEEPDAIGWRARFSVLIECKASHRDFIRDRQKLSRIEGGTYGMGFYRYYMAPEGLISKEELPPGWGLLEVDFVGRVHRTAKSKSWIQTPCGLRSELGLVLSGLRRYQEEKQCASSSPEQQDSSART